MDDVISLIWRSRVVIADFTTRNLNVFYETGIAHTLGGDVIQIAQPSAAFRSTCKASAPCPSSPTARSSPR